MNAGYEQKTVDSLIYLCRCAVNGEVPSSESLDGVDTDELYELADDHLLSSTAGMALESAGVKKDSFVQAVAQAQRKNTLLDVDRNKVLAELEKAGIWYMPMKGAILKDMYPRLGMRQMSDNDILVDPERRKDVREIMERLGFTTQKYEQANHDVYHKEPLSNFEMHMHLINGRSNELLPQYYDDVKERLIKDEGNGYGYHFSDSDFYLFLIAHEYKHYVEGGTGLRSLMDIWLYLKKKEKDLDWDYIRRETVKMGVDRFETVNRPLALHLFDGKPLPEAERQMMEYILSSGAYGTHENDIANQLQKKGRIGFVLSRMTLPKELMLKQYPILKKAPFLYPVMWVWRFIHRFFSNRKHFMFEIKAALGLVKQEEMHSHPMDDANPADH